MDIELLYKKMEGTLTPEEEKELELWMKSSLRHEAYFKYFSEYYTGERKYSLPALRFQLYRDAFFDRLVRKQKHRLRVRYIRRIGLAASLLLAAALGGLVYWGGDGFRTPPVADKETAVSDTLGGKRLEEAYAPKVSNGEVVLSTADNKTYTLDQLKEKTMASATYDTIRNLLSYEEKPVLSPAEASGKLNKLDIHPGAEFCMTLSDGTRVWLNADTELKYPTVFKGKNRRVWLKGEAYFEVAKDAEHPFYVSAGPVDVRVYGTQFNVNTRYRGRVATTLVDGSVAVIPKHTGQERMLTPGHTAEYNPQTHAMEINHKDIQLYTGWKDGTYHFEDISLGDFFDEISHWYDIRVVFLNEDVKAEAFSGIISRHTSLRKLLDMLEKTNYVGFRISGKTVEISKKE